MLLDRTRKLASTPAIVRSKNILECKHLFNNEHGANSLFDSAASKVEK
jgi:hypothetical protein